MFEVHGIGDERGTHLRSPGAGARAKLGAPTSGAHMGCRQACMIAGVMADKASSSG